MKHVTKPRHFVFSCRYFLESSFHLIPTALMISSLACSSAHLTPGSPKQPLTGMTSFSHTPHSLGFVRMFSPKMTCASGYVSSPGSESFSFFFFLLSHRKHTWVLVVCTNWGLHHSLQSLNSLLPYLISSFNLLYSRRPLLLCSTM